MGSKKSQIAIIASVIGVFALVLSVQQVQQYRSSAKRPPPPGGLISPTPEPTIKCIDCPAPPEGCYYQDRTCQDCGLWVCDEFPTPTPTPGSVGFNPQADLNRDGRISNSDLDIFTAVWGIVNSSRDWSYVFSSLDFNHDGTVDIIDRVYISNYNGRYVDNCIWSDINSDGIVDASDLGLFAGKFGQIGSTSARFDIDNDSYVTMLDLIIAEGEVGKVCLLP